MQVNYIPSESRGKADFGWLKARYSFSFAYYYNPDRMGFGALKVLNDDIVLPSTGFATHPHENMEIITIPLQGSLRHKDSTGSEGVITAGEVQIMSAGTGIFHSEFNASQHEILNLLQIWILPKKKDIPPRYSQKKFDLDKSINELVLVVSPEDYEHPSSLKINQQSWIYNGIFEPENDFEYRLHESNSGIFIMVISGSIKIGDMVLNERDAAEITNTDKIIFRTLSKCKILVIEIPL
ncbi:MAG: pirin family protein [Chitinophagales bacterium]|nr:pirin family protein [Chitinophagales bacterium]MDW8273389.1 pirin family protein [Chitinophagales bacterium]